MSRPPREPPDGDHLIPPHGGYRKLKSFQMAELCFDVTVRFCKRYVDRRSRTYDQMVQAARSGTQNIVEGSAASGTSKKTELKLTDTARFSLEELGRDYRDFLRQRSRKEWSYSDPTSPRTRRRTLLDRRGSSTVGARCPCPLRPERPETHLFGNRRQRRACSYRGSMLSPRSSACQPRKALSRRRRLYRTHVSHA